MKKISKLALMAAGVVATIQALREPAARTAPAPGHRREGSGNAEALAMPADDRPSAALGGFFKELKDGVKEDNLPLVAAGLAYYAMLALVPGLIALVSTYGLAFDPADVRQQIADLSDILPSEARELVLTQLNNLVDAPTAGLGIGLALSTLGALWSASSGVKALITATNIVYGEQETRGFLRVRGLALLFTLGIVAFLTVAVGALVVVPRLLRDFPGPTGELLSLATWPGVAVSMALGLAILYRFGPNHSKPKWQWASWGAIGASVAWLLLTLLFSLYVSRFGTFDATYGALAGVILLLLWFFLSGFVVLLGAEVNAVLDQRKAAGAS